MALEQKVPQVAGEVAQTPTLSAVYTLEEARKVILAQIAAEKKARKDAPLPDGVEEITRKQWLEARVIHEQAENDWHRACCGFSKGASRAAYAESLVKSSANLIRYKKELADES